MANCTASPNVSDEWTLKVEPFRIYDYILCFLVVIGILGNTLVILVKCRGLSSSAGETVTNRLIIGLAAADLLSAVFIAPLPEFANVPRNAAGEFYCRVIESRALAWICLTASVYILTAISLERYLGVVHPYYYRAWMNRHRIRYSFVAVWISAVAINFHTVAFHTVGECGNCDTRFPSTRFRKINGIFVFLIEFLSPLFIMTYTSIRSIYVLMRKREDISGGETVSRNVQSPELELLRRRFTKMFIFIYASFMILWAPDQVWFLLYNLGMIAHDHTGENSHKHFVNLAFLNAASVNPIIYSICLASFRQAVKDLFMCRGRGTSSLERVTEISTTDRVSANS